MKKTTENRSVKYTYTRRMFAILMLLLAIPIISMAQPVFAASTEELMLSSSSLENTVIYAENFDQVEAFDALGWEMSESLKTNTAIWTIEDGKLFVDNYATSPSNDSYCVAVPASIMDPVVKGDYTVQWDMTYLEASSAARYITVLLNYDRSVGNTYLSFHFRPKGYADFQSRINGTWSNLDATGSIENGVARPSAKNTDPTIGEPICQLLWDKAYVDADTLLIMNEPITVRLEYHAGEALKVFMNDVYITATDAAGWKNVEMLSGSSEIAVKVSTGCKATIDNFVVASGIGIPEDPFAASSPIPSATDISDSVKYIYKFLDDASPRVIREDAVKYEAEAYTTVAPVLPGSAERNVDGITYDVIWHNGTTAQAKSSYVVNVMEAGEYELVICGTAVQNESTPSDRGISWWLEGGERYQAVITPIISSAYKYNNLPREGFAMGYVYNIPLSLKAGDNILNFGHHTELGKEGRINFDCFYIQKPAKADIVSGDFLYRAPVESEDRITITGYVGAGGVVTIPSTLDGYLVYEIGACTFMNRTDITSVVLPDTLGWIGGGAFAGCTGLNAMPTSASLVQIEAYAFYACDGLTSVTLPDTLEFLGRGAFADCNGLREVTILANFPEYVVGDTFISCDLKKAIFLGDAVETINSSVFPSTCPLFVSPDAAGWTFPTWNGYTTYLIGDDLTIYTENGYRFQKLHSETEARVVGYDASIITKTAAIPETLGGVPVTEIGAEAFRYNTALESVTFPSSVRGIGDNAFAGCSILQSIALSEGLTTIGDFAFQGCTALSAIGLPDSITTIGEGAFAGCTRLSAITLPAGMTEIPTQMFSTCSTLESITIPSGVKSIGNFAFVECRSLRKVFFTGELPTEIDVTAFENTSAELLLILSVPQTNYPTWQSPDGATYKTAIRREDGVVYCPSEDGTGVAFVCFDNNATEVVIPDTIDGLPVTEIYAGAFTGKAVTKVTLPDTVTVIGKDAFHLCKQLAEVNMPSALREIRYRAFNGCTVLQDITLPEGLTTIGDYVFPNCRAFTKMNIPSTLQNFGRNMFPNCTALAKVTLPAELTVIPPYTFKGCTALKHIEIPLQVAEIGEKAFEGSGLTSITFLGGTPLLATEDALSADVRIYADPTIVGWTFPTWTATNGVTYNTSTITYSSADLLYEKISDIAIRILAYTGKGTEIVIPETIDGYNVVSIGMAAFKGNKTLTSVTLPDSIQEIEEGAFYNCSALASINFPISLGFIGDNAFYNCDKLTEVAFPEGLMQIGAQAFYDCDGISEVVIPEQVTSIGDRAFYSCGVLKNVELKNGNAELGINIFNSCHNLTTLTLPQNLLIVPANFASACSALKTITIPASVLVVNPYAFNNSGLRQVYFEGDAPAIANTETFPVMAEFYVEEGKQGWTFPSWTAISGETFPVKLKSEEVILTEGDYQYKVLGGNARITKYSGSAAELVVPSTLGGYTVDSIGYGAFASRKKLTSITLPKTITQIDEAAFHSCSALKSAILPEKMTYLGEAAFTNCTSLTAIALPSGLTEISKSLFAQCENITVIRIPEGVKTIGGQAFAACKGLIEVTLPSTLQTIGSSAFSACEALTGISLPEGLRTIQSYAFKDCTALEAVTLPSSLATLYSSTFAGSGVTTLYFQGNAPKISSSTADLDNVTFVVKAGTTGWTFPTWKASNGRIYNMVEDALLQGGYKFAAIDDTQLKLLSYSGTETALTIPAEVDGMTVATIADKAFNGNTTIQSVVIPDSVTAIGNYAFQNCTALTSVTLSANLKTIGNSAFYGCSSLYDISLPSTLHSIGSNAFYKCVALTVLVLPDNLVQIGGSALMNTGITELTLPNTLLNLNGLSICNTKLQNVYVSETHPQYASFDGVVFSRDMKTLIFYPTGRTGTYCIPSGVEMIEKLAFVNSQLTNLHFPESVTHVAQIKSTAKTRGLYFYGDLPTYDTTGWYSAVESVIKNITVYYVEGKNGWTTPTLTLNAGGKYEETYITVPFTAEGYLYTTDGSQVTITGYVGTQTKLTIPTTIAGLPVTAIGEKAFYGNKTIQQVIIPDSIKTIGVSAFNSCSALTTVTLPNGLTQIAESTFCNSGLTSIDIPASVTLIDKYAFWYCYSLTSVTLHEGLETLATNAFESCGLTEIALPASLRSVTFGTFSSERLERITVSADNPYFTAVDGILFSKDMKTIYAYPGARTGSYAIPDGVETIAISAFRRSQLTSLTIPASVTYMDRNLFFKSTLTEIIFMGDVPKYANSRWFGTEKEDAPIPDDLIIYYDSTKSGWTTPTWTKSEGTSVAETYNTQPLALIYDDFTYTKTSDTTVTITGYVGTETKLAIPMNINGLSVTAIGEKAFYGNKTIQQVVIPDSVTAIGHFAFQNCTALTSVALSANLKTIGNSAFHGCKALPALSLPEGLTTLGSMAIMNTGIKELTLPDSLSNVNGTSVCSLNLTHIYVSDTHPMYISQGGVIYSRDKKTLYLYPSGRTGTYRISEGVEIVADYAFFNSRLTAIHIPASVKEISQIRTTTTIKNLYFYGDLPKYGENGWFRALDGYFVTVYYVEGKNGWTTPTLTLNAGGKYEETYNTVPFTAEGYLYTTDGSQVTITGYVGTQTKLTIPTTIAGLPVTAIGEKAFQKNQKLTQVTIPEGITTIGEFAFNGCTALTTANLPSTLTVLDIGAFQASGLTAIEIPGSVSVIRNQVFWHCKALISAILSEGITELGTNAFDDTGIVEFHLPSTLEKLGLGSLSSTSLTNITVAENSPYFASVDGVLFSADMKTIWVYPTARTGSYIVPDGVEKVAVSAFRKCQITEVTLPASVTYVDRNVFYESALTSITFMGDVPDYPTTYWWGDYEKITIYYDSTKSGWTTPTWTKSEGTSVAETYNTQPFSRPVVIGLAWNLSDKTITWNAVSDAVGYEVQLYRNGTLVTSFTTAESMANYNDICTTTGEWTFCVRSLGQINSLWSSMSAPQQLFVLQEVIPTIVTAINGSEWSDVLKKLPNTVSIRNDDGTVRELPVIWHTQSVSGYDKAVTAYDQVFAVPGTMTLPAEYVDTDAVVLTEASVTVLKQQIVLKENTSTSLKIETKLDINTTPNPDQNPDPDIGGGEPPQEKPAYLIGVQATVAHDITAPVVNTVAIIVAEIDNSVADKVTILAADGKTELAEDAVIGTGSVIQLKDENNNVIDEVVIVVTGDATGDGHIDEGDLTALETVLSAKLETSDSFNDAQKAALNMDGEDSVNAIDLRDMLIKLGGN